MHSLPPRHMAFCKFLCGGEGDVVALPLSLRKGTRREVSSNLDLHLQIGKDRSPRPPFQRSQKLLDSQHMRDYGLCSEIRNLVNFVYSHLSFPIALSSKPLKVKQISYDDFGGLQESEISKVNRQLWRRGRGTPRSKMRCEDFERK